MSAYRRTTDSNSGDKKRSFKDEIKNVSEKKPPTPKKDSQSIKREVERIIGVTDDNGELEIGIKFKGKEKMELIPARVANLEFPQQIIAYYEERLVWESQDGTTVKASTQNKNNNAA